MISVNRLDFPRIKPIRRDINRFRGNYILFIETLYNVLGGSKGDIKSFSNTLESGTSVNLNATTNLLNGFEMTTSGTLNKLMISESTAKSSFTGDKVPVIPTGTIKFTGKSSPDTGWILIQEGTIGSASSGATVRANADTINLYSNIWNTMSDINAPVSGGRGASATADFNANKTIQLPSLPGRVVGCSGSGSGLTTRSDGDTAGEETHATTTAETAAHGHWIPVYTSGSVDTTSRTEWGGFSLISIADATTPDASQTMTNNGSAENERNNMQKTYFRYAWIKL